MLHKISLVLLALSYLLYYYHSLVLLVEAISHELTADAPCLWSSDPSVAPSH